MIIKDLELTHFGKFHYKKITFHSGVNVFYGENETGKSTIHAFIRGMLFGIERQKGRAARSDRYTKYEPWDNHGAYCGKMRIEAEGTIYRLERSFLKTDRSFRLIDETNGIEMEPAQECLDQLLGGLTENRFINTVSIEQLKCATDAGLIHELQRFMCNTGNTKSTEIDLADALTNLKMQKKRSENRLDAASSKRLSANKKELEETEQEIAQLKKDERERREEGLELRKKLNSEKTLTASVKTAHEKEKEALKQRYEKAKQEYHEYTVDTYGLSKKNVPSVVLLALGLFALCGGGYSIWIHVFDGILQFLFIACLGIISVGCLLSSYFYRKYYLQQKEKLQNALEEKETKRRLADQYEEEYLQVASQPPNNVSENYIELIDRLKALQDALNRITWDIEQKEEYRIELLNEQEALWGAQEENLKLQVEIDAITLAIDTIQKLANKVHGSFGVELNEEASVMLEHITKGKYHSVIVKDDMSVFLNTPDRYVPLEGVSRGTMEQIYLCIRLAAARLLWEHGDMPLLFDDIFVFYDDERLKETMKFLNTLENQVIIFTCHKREMEYGEKFKNELVIAPNTL